MLRFEVPAKPISELDRTEIRALAKPFGGYRQTATRVVMALLPAIKRLEIFRDDGCTDLYEWAAKFLAMPRDPVDRALALYQRIAWTLHGSLLNHRISARLLRCTAVPRSHTSSICVPRTLCASHSGQSARSRDASHE